MKTPIRICGYVRVSSKDSVEGESLTTQRASITQFAKGEGYQLIEIFADEGISGGTVKDRPALLQLLHAGRTGQFDMLVVHRLSRFGRNVTELLTNYEELKASGIELRSISEGIDFSSKYGKMVLVILGAIAELEREVIRETMLENRIAKGRRGIPTTGSLPYGRTFNKETGQWELDATIALTIERVAREYLSGGSLFDIARTVPMSYSNLAKTLRENCGDTWTVEFEGEKPIVYQIPRLLSEDIITRVRDRLLFNRTANRTDIINRFVLTGFLRCEHCGLSLKGQTQTFNNTEYRYYTHIAGKFSKCHAFTTVPLEELERAIFTTIFENFVDVPSFERAIADSLPDEKLIKDLEMRIKSSENQLKMTSRELDKLVDLALTGTLSKETISKKEQSLIEIRTKIEETLQADRDQFNSLPNIDTIRDEAEHIRRQLLEQFSGTKRLKEMSFDDKRNLLHWLFDGKDQKGSHYGIYIMKTGRRNNQKIDYFMYGRITGLRTLKDGNINYQEDSENYITNITTRKPLERLYNIQFKIRETA